jgi:hypothetical protein
MLRIAGALTNYEDVWGCLPYDARGSDYALYKLYPAYVDSTKWFHCPENKKGHVGWDEEHQRILGGDYVYIDSLQHLRVGLKDQTTPLIWERRGLRKDGGNVVFMNLKGVWLNEKDFAALLAKWDTAGK